MRMFWVGIISSIFIIIGMGITISLIGIITLFSKRFAKSIFPEESKTFEKVYNGISLTGAILLIVLGFTFFIGTF